MILNYTPAFKVIEFFCIDQAEKTELGTKTFHLRMTHKNAAFPKLNRQLFIFWLIIRLLVWFSAFAGKSFQSKSSETQVVVPSIPSWISWANGTGDSTHLQFSAVHKIFSSTFLPKAPGLNAEDIRTKDGVKNREWQCGGTGESRDNEQAHTHLLQSEPPVDVTDMPVIVDNKLSGNKGK